MIDLMGLNYWAEPEPRTAGGKKAAEAAVRDDVRKPIRRGRRNDD
jgi:hypothetical protein